MDPAEFWATGDYAVVGDLWAQPGRDLAASLPVRGRDVVDLATGTGVTAIAAARHGARSVVGVDVTPDLLREAARRADGAGVDVTWLTADLVSVPLPSRCDGPRSGGRYRDGHQYPRLGDQGPDRGDRTVPHHARGPDRAGGGRLRQERFAGSWEPLTLNQLRRELAEEGLSARPYDTGTALVSVDQPA